MVWVGIFGAVDALATLIASLGWGSTGFAGLVAIVAVALWLVPSLRAARPAAVPLLLCIDNLVDALRPVDVLPAGLVSAAMAFAGFVACSMASTCGARYAELPRDASLTAATRFQ